MTLRTAGFHILETSQSLPQSVASIPPPLLLVPSPHPTFCFLFFSSHCFIYIVSSDLFSFELFLFFFWGGVFFLGPHPRHMDVPRLGVQLELQRPAYTTATATWVLSRICDLRHSSWQHRILNPMSEARDRTQNLMVTIWLC